MNERYQTPKEFLAAHKGEFEDLEEMFGVDDDESAAAPARRPNKEWVELQRARAEYLREWEEDIKYAQELANEGM